MIGTPIISGGTLVVAPGAETPAASPGAPTEEPPPATEAPTQSPEEPEAQPTEFKFEEPPLPKTYTIQKGEFPFCIARRFDVDVSELLSLNGLGVNSLVSVGYNLKIPQTGNGFQGQRALAKHPDTYTVSTNDTIYSIACQYGNVYPEAIAQANGISKPYNLKVGQKLHIP